MPPTQQQIIGRLRQAQAKDLLKRGFKVQAKARLLLSGNEDHIKRVDTGHLRSSIQVQLRKVTGAPIVRVGSHLKYSRWVHDGTGLYGPRKKRIVPKHKKALAFKSKKFGKKRIVVKSVKGMRGNPYLKDAMPAAKLKS